MSQVSQGPGWWLASDGRWYPPEQVPGYPAPGPTAESASSTGDQIPSPVGGADPAPTPASDPGVPAFPPEPDWSGQAISPATGYGSEAYGSGYGPPPGPGYGPTVGPGYPPPAGSGHGPPPAPPGYLPPVDPLYGYPPAGPPYGYLPVQRTNGLAVASLVCSLVWLGGLGSILGIVFGIVARSQIRKAEGNVQGNGLALAGIIIGVVGLVAMILFVVLVAVVVNHCDQSGNCTTNTYNFGN